MFLLGMEKQKQRLAEDILTKWTKMNTALQNDRNVSYFNTQNLKTYIIIIMQVKRFEPELVIPTVKHFYSEPTDPLWDLQWHLVGFHTTYPARKFLLVCAYM